MKFFQNMSVLTTVCALAMASNAMAQTPAPPARSPGIELALQAAETAVAACAASGYNVSVTVLDAAGTTRLTYASDKAAAGPINSATKKAYTALAFKEATADVATQQTADPAVDARIKADPKLFPKAGGFPLKAGADLIGAIGVGGAPGGDKDAVCAQAGIAKIQALLK